MNKSELRDLLVDHFNLTELNNLCFDLNINHERIAGATIDDKARELVAFCDRHGRLDELIKQFRQLRPRLDWSHEQLTSGKKEKSEPRSASDILGSISPADPSPLSALAPSKPTTEDQVLNMIRSSQPEDFRYDDSTGVFFHKLDESLRIVIERDKEPYQEFFEPWVSEFPNPRGFQQPVYIYYGQTRILEVPCVYVDGARYLIPYPRSANDLTLTPFRYHIGHILNDHIRGHDFDIGLEIAGIKVRKQAA